jgi:hypothetical protein
MNINNNDTAVVVIDPQNDVLSETGVSLDLVGALHGSARWCVGLSDDD